MSDYYFDEDHGVAYKIDPVNASVVKDDGESGSMAILVHTDVKVTNIKKEKVRRTISELFPPDRYDLDSAREIFCSTYLPKVVRGAKKISEEEYTQIKERFEA